MLIVISAQVRELFDLRRDGRIIFRGSHDECIKKLQEVQSSSWNHALKYEGYTITSIFEDPPKNKWNYGKPESEGIPIGNVPEEDKTFLNHPYDTECDCDRCTWERRRQEE